jgi:hypothetical protein
MIKLIKKNSREFLFLDVKARASSEHLDVFLFQIVLPGVLMSLTSTGGRIGMLATEPVADRPRITVLVLVYRPQARTIPVRIAGARSSPTEAFPHQRPERPTVAILFSAGRRRRIEPPPGVPAVLQPEPNAWLV